MSTAITDTESTNRAGALGDATGQPRPGVGAVTETARPKERPTSRSHLANEAWEALLTAHSVLMKDFSRSPIWEKASMREYDVLYTLSKAGGPQRLSELGQHVLLSQPALSRLVDRLEERGLLSRCEDPADGRAVHLALTDAGRALQREIGLAHGRDVARVVSAALTDTELITLRELATRLHHTQEES